MRLNTLTAAIMMHAALAATTPVLRMVTVRCD